MTALTRSPDEDDREGWQVYFRDVRIGSIGKFTGVPLNDNQWSRSLGFYPDMEVGPRGHHGAGLSTANTDHHAHIAHRGIGA